MVITIDFLDTLEPVPIVHTNDELRLRVNTASGESLYLGYVEVAVTVPCFWHATLAVPLSAVSMSEYNEDIPVIVGTNTIWLCKGMSVGTEGVPSEWETAFRSIRSDRVAVVKTATKITIKPYETRTVTGFVRKNHDSVSTIKEPLEDGLNSKVTVCRRVVKTDLVPLLASL